jgi:hypothetical protein
MAEMQSKPIHIEWKKYRLTSLLYILLFRKHCKNNPGARTKLDRFIVVHYFFPVR